MAKRVQRRRGTTTEHNTFTGYEGEITVDITKDTAVIHDGSTAGGFPLARQDLNNVSLNISIADMNIVDGTNGQFLQTNGSGTMSFATIDASSTAVGGDVTGTVSNIQIAANKVGIAELNVSDGTANQFLKTDGSGSLSFGTVVTDPTMGGDVGGTTSASVIQPAAVEGSMLDPALKQFTEDATGEIPTGGYGGSAGVAFPAGDGTTTTYNLSIAAAANNALVVSIDGIMQPTQSYSLPSTTSIQFDDPPPTGSSIRILHIGFQVAASTPADGSVTTIKLGGGAVTNTKLADSASTDSIRAVTTNHIRDDAVTTDKIAQNAVTATEIAPGTITGTEIQNASITGLDIASNAIDGGHIAIGTAQGDTMYYDGTNWVKLTYGTTGHVLTTAGVNSNPYWAAGSSGTALPGVGNVGDVLTNVAGGWIAAAHEAGMYQEEMFLVDSVSTTGANTGTWTKAAGVTSIEVFCTGAGGRGGAGLSTNAPPCGGKAGDGGFSRQVLDVTNITSLEYHLGRGWNTSQSHQAGGSQGTGLTAFGKNESLTYNALTVTVVAGAITAIAFSGATIGSGLTQVPLIGIEPNAFHLTGKLGTGAIATAVVAGGAVTGITITNGGSGYVSGQVNAFFGLCGGNLGGTGGNASGTATGSPGAVGLAWGSIGNVGFNNSGPIVGVGGSGSCVQGMGGFGSHGGIWIKSYK